MVNDDGKPSALPSRRRMRTHAEWKVETHIFWATGPTSAATRCFISSAALFVNVMARISNGDTPSAMRWAMRCVSTRVLPDPAPATTSSGPEGWTTASAWSGFSPARRSCGPPIARPMVPTGCDGSGDAETLAEEAEHLVERFAGGVTRLVDEVLGEHRMGAFRDVVGVAR